MTMCDGDVASGRVRSTRCHDTARGAQAPPRRCEQPDERSYGRVAVSWSSPATGYAAAPLPHRHSLCSHTP